MPFRLSLRFNMSTMVSLLPLVIAVLLIEPARGQQCLQGFAASPLTTPCTTNDCEREDSNNEVIRVVPGLSFSCNGVITGWMAQGEFARQSMRVLLPELQIWRPLDADMLYERNASVSGVCSDSGGNLLCTFTSPITVQTDDVIGIHLRIANQARFIVFFMSSDAPINYIFDDAALLTVDLTTVNAQHMENDLPLISVQFTPDPVVMPTTQPPTETSTTPPPSSSSSTTPPPPSSSSSPSSSTTPPPPSSSSSPSSSTTPPPPSSSSSPSSSTTPPPPSSSSSPSSSTTPPPSSSSSTAPQPTTAASTTTQDSSTVSVAPTSSSDTAVDTTTIETASETPPTPQATSSSTPMPVTTSEAQSASTSNDGNTVQPTGSDGNTVQPTASDGNTMQMTTSDGNTMQMTTSDNTVSTSTTTPTSSDDTNVQTSSSTSSPVSATPLPPAPPPPAASADIAATAGGVAAGVVVVLGLAAVLVALLLIIARRRRRGKKAYNLNTATSAANDIALNNPTYTDVIALQAHDTDTKPRLQYMESAADYSVVGADYDDVGPPIGEYEVPSQSDSLDFNTIANSTTLPATEKRPPPLPLETMPKRLNVYEWGLVVPSQEQRDNLGSDQFATGAGESVYEALVEHNKPEPAPHFFEECETYWAPSTKANELYQQLATRKYREILRPHIQITEHLGSGQFGTVSKGLWQSPAGAMEVAVKTLKSGSPEEDKVKFLQEAAINGQFRHPNIVQLMGVVTVGEPVMIVLELLANGDLREFLLKQRPDPGQLLPTNTNRLLLKFCQQVASGMEYLARKAFVHRDLAARNILVADDKICKISDFGMSRDLMDENYYVSHGGKIPVKWTAPEAINYKKYSTASDVWSFGAVMYEIWSLGRKPYEAYTNSEVIQLVLKGFRLPPPPGCPREVYKLMINCWHPDRASRPSFAQMVETLSQPHFDLLMWREADTKLHPQVTVVGAPLEAAENLYPALQKSYVRLQKLLE